MSEIESLENHIKKLKADHKRLKCKAKILEVNISAHKKLLDRKLSEVNYEPEADIKSLEA